MDRNVPRVDLSRGSSLNGNYAAEERGLCGYVFVIYKAWVVPCPPVSKESLDKVVLICGTVGKRWHSS